MRNTRFHTDVHLHEDVQVLVRDHGDFQALTVQGDHGEVTFYIRTLEQIEEFRRAIEGAEANIRRYIGA